MYCNSIGQSDYSDNTIAELFHPAPKPNSIVVLNLNVDWILNYFDAPLFLQIAPFSQNFILEISSKFVFWHIPGIYRTQRTQCSERLAWSHPAYGSVICQQV